MQAIVGDPPVRPALTWSRNLGSGGATPRPERTPTTHRQRPWVTLRSPNAISRRTAQAPMRCTRRLGMASSSDDRERTGRGRRQWAARLHAEGCGRRQRGVRRPHDHHGGPGGCPGTHQPATRTTRSTRVAPGGGGRRSRDRGSAHRPPAKPGRPQSDDRAHRAAPDRRQPRSPRCRRAGRHRGRCGARSLECRSQDQREVR